MWDEIIANALSQLKLSEIIRPSIDGRIDKPIVN